MKYAAKTAALLIALGMTSTASATSFTFLDSPASSTVVSEGTFFGSSVNYTGLDGPITSAILTIFLSDDASTLVPINVDVPAEHAELSFVSGNASDVSPGITAEVDGNSSFIGSLEVDNIITPPLGTVSPYFSFDATSLLFPLTTSGAVSFQLNALNTRNNFPILAGGGIYLEDFNYEGAELSIETSAVPVPAAVWLLGSGLMGLFGFSRKKSKTA